MAPSSAEKKSEKEVEVVISYRLEVHDGLEGFDEDLDELMNLFEELQHSSGDIANPELDLLTFASSADYFGVLVRDEIHTITETDVPPEATTKKSMGSSEPIRGASLGTALVNEAEVSDRDAGEETEVSSAVSVQSQGAAKKKRRRRKKWANKAQETSGEGQVPASLGNNAGASTSASVRKVSEKESLLWPSTDWPCLRSQRNSLANRL